MFFVKKKMFAYNQNDRIKNHALENPVNFRPSNTINKCSQDKSKKNAVATCPTSFYIITFGSTFRRSPLYFNAGIEYEMNDG